MTNATETIEYEELNDAFANPRVRHQHQVMLRRPVQPGVCRIEVWYQKPATLDRMLGRTQNFSFENSHALLGTVEFRRDYQTLYGPLQGDFWSPAGEARALIEKLGLQHTSMMVGDVLVVYYPEDFPGEDGDQRVEIWMVTPNGWKECP